MLYLKRSIKFLKEYFYDHPAIRIIFEYGITTLAAFLSATFFAFGYKSFIDPIIENGVSHVIVTGGASGVAQIIVKIFEMFGFPIAEKTPFGDFHWNYIIQSASYVCVNIPIFFLMFKKVGLKFGVFTVVNVVAYFIVVNYIPDELTTMFYTNASLGFEGDLLARSIFGGICTGLAAVIAYKFDHSTGGIDALSVYVNDKAPHISLGKVAMMLNFCIVVVYTILSIVNDGGSDLSYTTMALYSCIYFYTSSTFIDMIMKRDKKSQLQIVTSNENLPDILINYFPHSCTIVDGKGAYSKQKRLIVYTVLSLFEVKRAVKIIKEIDPSAFVVINNVSQVHGRFYIQPRK